MRTSLIALLVVALGGLVILVFQQRAALREERTRVQELNAKLETKSKAADLELQEKCAKQAHDRFLWSGWGKDKTADFVNHYSEKLNKCFVQIENTDASNPAMSWTHKSLFDAFEGKVYAQYDWHTDRKKKFWEVPPVNCKVTLPSGEEKNCQSEDEFKCASGGELYAVGRIGPCPPCVARAGQRAISEVNVISMQAGGAP